MKFMFSNLYKIKTIDNGKKSSVLKYENLIISNFLGIAFSNDILLYLLK